MIECDRKNRLEKQVMTMHFHASYLATVTATEDFIGHTRGGVIHEQSFRGQIQVKLFMKKTI